MLGRPNRWFTNLLMVTFRFKITVTFRVRSAIVLVMVRFLFSSWLGFGDISNYSNPLLYDHPQNHIGVVV